MMKIFYLALVIIILLSPPGESQQPDSPGIIRLKVDLDSVALQINGEIVGRDSSGNLLLPDVWFILNRPGGDYEVRFQREGYDPIETNITLLPGEVSSFEAGFLTVKEDTAETYSSNANLNLLSDPNSAKIIIETLADTIITPKTLYLVSGDHSFKAMADGYQDLNQNISIEPDKNISLNFRLAFSQPVGLTAEDLNLEYMPLIPLKNEMDATNQKEMFNNFAETFALIPLGQGILARLLLGNDTEASANILIAVGTGLSAGSYILGKILPKRKLAKIREFNKEAASINNEAKSHNEEIEIEVENSNTELLEKWMMENQNRGTVEISAE
jgi:hypothetical protein